MQDNNIRTGKSMYDTTLEREQKSVALDQLVCEKNLFSSIYSIFYKRVELLVIQ